MVDLYIINKQVPVVQKTEPLKSLSGCHVLWQLRHRSRKEVFQPHLPVRLPCYDLAPITSFTLGRSLRLRTSGTPGFHGLTGGVYKARERIHRAMADARLLANPASWSRVADSSPNWERFWGLASTRVVAALCTPHCNTCVAPDVRAVLIWRHPHLPHILRWQSCQSPQRNLLVTDNKGCARYGT